VGVDRERSVISVNGLRMRMRAAPVRDGEGLASSGRGWS
jgi:hypothetical protein